MTMPNSAATPKPGVGQNPGNSGAVDSSGAPAHSRPESVPPHLGGGTAAAEGAVSQPILPLLSINHEAELMIRWPAGYGLPNLRLTPEQTLAVGDFLHATRHLWRA